MTAFSVKVDEMSVVFDDYTPEAKARHEGRSMFIGLHVPREMAKHLTLSTMVTIVIDDGVAGSAPCGFSGLHGGHLLTDDSWCEGTKRAE